MAGMSNHIPYPIVLCIPSYISNADLDNFG